MSLPLALQYPVKRSEHVELDKKLQSQLTLFPYSIILTAVRFVYSIPRKVLT